MLFAKLVIDLTPGDGRFAQVCLKSRTSYLGVCFTDEHKELMMQKLVSDLKKYMADPSSGVYDARYAAAIGAAPSTTDPGEGDPNPPSKRGRGRGRPGGRRGGGRGRGTGKGKRSGSGGGGQDGGDDDPPPEPEKEEEDDEESEEDPMWDPLA